MNPDNAQRIAQQIASGDWEPLSPTDVEALRELLDGNDPQGGALRTQIAALRPEVPRDWQAPAPAAAEWDALWDRVRAAPVESRSLRVRAVAWRTMAAAAACVMLALPWWLARSAEDLLEPARNVQINELEVFGAADAFVVNVDDEGFQVIWVLDEDEREGA